MAPIFTKKKIEEFLTAGNDIAIPVLSLVKDASAPFPPLYYAATGALFIASNVKVSSLYPKRQSTFLLTVQQGLPREQERVGRVQPIYHGDGWRNCITMGGALSVWFRRIIRTIEEEYRGGPRLNISLVER